MPQISPSNPTKAQLQATLSRHEEGLEREIKSFSQGTDNMIRNVILAGGSLVLTYLIVSRLLRSDGREEGDGAPQKEGKGKDTFVHFATRLSEVVAERLIVMLLELAREKLIEYLQRRKEKRENTDDTATEMPEK